MDKKKILELLKSDVYDIELKGCGRARTDEKLEELADRICNVLPKDSTEKHGKWITTKANDKLLCSECDVISRIDMYPFGSADYCPNCGVRMDLESDI